MGNLKVWNDYFKQIKEIGTNVTEHSLRTPFENLLNDIKPNDSIKVIHEQKRQQGFGTPDFRVEAEGASIGYKELSELGTELIEHHLMKKSYPDNHVTFPVAGNDEIEDVKFEKGKAYINRTQYFDNITPEVWEFYVGGYQVLDKWLKPRKDRTLSYEEKETFTKIVNILDFTIKQMERIDEVVKEVG